MMKIRHVKLDGDDDGNSKQHNSFKSHNSNGDILNNDGDHEDDDNNDNDDDLMIQQHQNQLQKSRTSSGRLMRALKNMKDIGTITTNAMIPPISPANSLVKRVVRNSGNIITLTRSKVTSANSMINNNNGSFRSSNSNNETLTKDEIMDPFNKMASTSTTTTTTTKKTPTQQSSKSSSRSISSSSSSTSKIKNKVRSSSKQRKDGEDVDSVIDNNHYSSDDNGGDETVSSNRKTLIVKKKVKASSTSTTTTTKKKKKIQSTSPFVYNEENNNNKVGTNNSISHLQSSFNMSVHSKDTKSTITTYVSPTKNSLTPTTTPASILRKSNPRYSNGGGGNTSSPNLIPVPQTPSNRSRKQLGMVGTNSPKSNRNKSLSPTSTTSSYRMEPQKQQQMRSPQTIGASVQKRKKVVRKISGETNTTTGTSTYGSYDQSTSSNNNNPSSKKKNNQKQKRHLSADDIDNNQDEETEYHMSFANSSAFGISTKTKEFHVVNRNNEYHDPMSSTSTSPRNSSSNNQQIRQDRKHSNIVHHDDYKEYDDDNDTFDDDDDDDNQIQMLPPMPFMSPVKANKKTLSSTSSTMKKSNSGMKKVSSSSKTHHDDDNLEHTIHSTKSESIVQHNNNKKPCSRTKSESNIITTSKIVSSKKNKPSSSTSVCSKKMIKSKKSRDSNNNNDRHNEEEVPPRKAKSMSTIPTNNSNHALTPEEQELLFTSLAAAMIGIDMSSVMNTNTAVPSKDKKKSQFYTSSRIEPNVDNDINDDDDCAEDDDDDNNNEDENDFIVNEDCYDDDDDDDNDYQLEQYIDDDDENDDNIEYQDHHDYHDDDNDENDEQSDHDDGEDYDEGDAQYVEDDDEQDYDNEVESDAVYDDDDGDDDDDDEEQEEDDETPFHDDDGFDEQLVLDDEMLDKDDYENIPDDKDHDDEYDDSFIENDDQYKEHGADSDEVENGRRSSKEASNETRRRSSRKSTATTEYERRRSSQSINDRSAQADVPEPTRLYVYAQQCKWSKVSKECKARGTDSRFVSEIDGGYTALHLAVISRCNPHTFYYDNENNCIDDVAPAPLSVIEELIIACPEAAIIRCTKKRYTPLSYACSAPSADHRYDMRDTASLVKMILKYAPHSAMVFTDDEMSPIDIHIVSYSERIRQQEQKQQDNRSKKDDLTKRTKTSTAVISVLLEANPTLAEARAYKESIVGPIELLYRCNLNKYKLISREDEFDVKKGKHGSTSQNNHTELEILDDWWAWKWTLILLQYSFKAGSIDKDDEVPFVPLHAAANLTACPIAILSLALNSDPKQIEERSPKDDLYNLPLHDVCGWISHDNIISGDPFVLRRKERAIMLLLHAFPKAARMTNNVGETPLQLAIETCTPWEKGLKVLLRHCPNALLFPRKLPSSGHVNQALSSAITLMHYGENESLCSEDEDYFDDPLETVEGMYPFMLAVVLSHIPECRLHVPPTILFKTTSSFDDDCRSAVVDEAGNNEKRKKSHQTSIHSKELESLRTIYGLLRSKPEALQKFRDEEREACLEELRYHYQQEKEKEQKQKQHKKR